MSRTSAQTEMALLKAELRSISSEIASLKQALDTKYALATDIALCRMETAEMRKSMVTHDQFWPVKVLVFGATGIILTTVVGAIVALVVTR